MFNQFIVVAACFGLASCGREKGESQLSEKPAKGEPIAIVLHTAGISAKKLLESLDVDASKVCADKGFDSSKRLGRAGEQYGTIAGTGVTVIADYICFNKNYAWKKQDAVNIEAEGDYAPRSGLKDDAARMARYMRDVKAREACIKKGFENTELDEKTDSCRELGRPRQAVAICKATYQCS